MNGNKKHSFNRNLLAEETLNLVVVGWFVSWQLLNCHANRPTGLEEKCLDLIFHYYFFFRRRFHFSSFGFCALEGCVKIIRGN